MHDSEKKSSFDKMWKRKYEESKYRFESAGMFSNRRVRIGDITTFTIYGTLEKVTAEVIEKPHYMDSYRQIRYRGWLRCREPDGTIITANVDNIYYIDREGKRVR